MTDRKKAWDRAVKASLDLGIVGGGSGFIYGLHLMYHPLAYVVGGLFIAAACFFGGHDRMRRSDR
jgi:hypothetical protein